VPVSEEELDQFLIQDENELFGEFWPLFITLICQQHPDLPQLKSNSISVDYSKLAPIFYYYYDHDKSPVDAPSLMDAVELGSPLVEKRDDYHDTLSQHLLNCFNSAMTRLRIDRHTEKLVREFTDTSSETGKSVNIPASVENQGIKVQLPEEDQAAPDQQQKTPVETDEAEMSGKVATKIAKKHNYPDKDITAVCIAVACERDGITGRLEVAGKLRRGAKHYYKNTRRMHLVKASWLISEKGKTGFASHLCRLRKKAESPKYEASDGTKLADSIRKHYKVPEKYSLP